jgi:hypothetical protein
MEGNQLVKEFGIKLNNKAMQWLKPALIGWRTAQSRYIKFWNGTDAPYYNNERANVSLLAAGAWLNGFASLEEYRSHKGAGSDEKNGRTDLYITNRYQHAEIEAKHIWIQGGQGLVELHAKIANGIEGAVKDAQRLDRNMEMRIGCTFFVLNFPEKKYPDFSECSAAQLSKELSNFLKFKRADLLSWFFPAKTRHIQMPLSTPGQDKAFFPA